MIVVNGFVFYTRKNRSRRKGCCHFWGPFICTMIAAPLIMADLMRHLLQDQGIWKECDRPVGVTWDSRCTWSSSQYKCNVMVTPTSSECIDTKQENLAHLSPMGILFTIICTYTGFAFLFVGILWNANILKKCGQIREQWRELRGTNRPNAKSPSINHVGEGEVGV